MLNMELKFSSTSPRIMIPINVDHIFVCRIISIFVFALDFGFAMNIRVLRSVGRVGVVLKHNLITAIRYQGVNEVHCNKTLRCG